MNLECKSFEKYRLIIYLNCNELINSFIISYRSFNLKQFTGSIYTIETFFMGS